MSRCTSLTSHLRHECADNSCNGGENNNRPFAKEAFIKRGIRFCEPSFHCHNLITFNPKTSGKSRRAMTLFYLLYQKLAGPLGDPGSLIDPEVELFFSSKTPPSNFHWNEPPILPIKWPWIYAPQIPSLFTRHHLMLITRHHFAWRNLTCSSMQSSHCTPKPDLSRFACDFWPVVND